MAAHQLFLEVPRFDRIGERGRRGVVSLKALDDEFAGLAADWPKIAAALFSFRLAVMGLTGLTLAWHPSAHPRMLSAQEVVYKFFMVCWWRYYS